MREAVIMRKLKYYITSLVIIAVSTAAFTVFAGEATDEKAKAFLGSYGWETGECI